MKILVPGNPPDSRLSVVFLCENCGCKFEAYKGEYERQYSLFGNVSWYEVKCPCCDQFVRKEDK